MRPSQNLPLPLRICLLLITICDTPTIYPYIPEYTPPFLTTICDPPRIYPYLPEYTPPLLTTICDPPRIYLSLPESTPPPFLTTIYNPTPPPRQQLYICDQPRIYPSLQEYTPLSLEIIRFGMLFFLFSSSEPLAVHAHATRAPFLKSPVTGLIKEYDKTSDTFL